MASPRYNTYKYQFRVGRKIVRGGITKNLERQEQKHQQDHPKGHIKQVGRMTTEKAARKWKKEKGYRPRSGPAWLPDAPPCYVD